MHACLALMEEVQGVLAWGKRVTMMSPATANDSRIHWQRNALSKWREGLSLQGPFLSGQYRHEKIDSS
jgi:hypothetical protein